MVVDAVESDYPAWFCCGLVVVVGFTSLCAFCVATRCDFYGLMTYINVRSILMNAVYVKALKLSSASRNKYSAGEIINLITTDVERIRNFWFILQEYIYVPVMIIYCMIGLEFVIGHNMFYGLAVLILFTPINALLVQRASSCETKQMTFKDSRMKLMTDILAGIKIIKLYAWEKPMRKRVAQIRFQEAVQFRNAKIVYALLEGTFGLCPFLAVVASFTGFVLIDKRKLTPQIAFISLLLFNLMKFSIFRISGLVREAINTRVSLLRLQEYFCQPEIMPIQN
uniref:ABC transmembrane type-1 domain-containing protein n=1 Tax=Panagrolaimus sp. JU765 TaxID=591449 RepID=A0AC34Q480_9BILA